MSVSQELVQQFKSIICDNSLTYPEVAKYILWGNSNLQMALNYYYASRENKPAPPPDPDPSSTSSAWERLKHGAKKQKQTAQHINNLKKEYSLPVIGPTNSKEYFLNKSKVFPDVDYLPNVMNHHKEEGHVIGENEGVEEDESEEEEEEKVEQNLPSEKQEREKRMNEEPPKKTLPKQRSLGASFKRGASFTSPKIEPKVISKKIEEPLKRESSFQQLGSSDSVFLGQCFIDCFSSFKVDLGEYNNEQINIKPYTNKKPDHGKKGGRSKVAEEKVVVRISWEGNQIGRFQDNEARIFCPVLTRGYVSIKCWLSEPPTLLQQFSRYRLKAHIYLQRKAITIPIVETFQNQTKENPILVEFREVKEELNSLLLKLNLPITVQPLIQMRSKHNIQNRILRKSEYRITDDSASKRLISKMTDPFYKETQRTLTMGTKSLIPPKKPDEFLEQKEQSNNVEITEHEYDQLINLSDQKLTPTYPKGVFTSELHYYQALALTWTLIREGYYQSDSKQQLHPMWTQFQLPNDSPLYYNQFTGQISVKAPFHKSRCKGGILADEMGLGKTVMMIALLTTNIETTCKYRTLVIVPLTLLDQWETEINTHTKYNSVRIYKYYEKKSRSQPLQNYDIVITTYGVISNEFAQGLHISKQGLYKQEWFRVILDEAHYIKGRVIQTSKAVFNLKSQINWCLTGTPIQNKLDDMFSLIHFIRYTPWSDYTWWNNYINKPHNEQDPAVFPVLRTILKNVLLRRTKQSRLENGDFIIRLPPKTSKIKYVRFMEDQRQFYDAVYEIDKKEFDEIDKRGIIEAKYMKIFEILIRLRQICCHRSLFKTKSKFSNVEQFQGKFKKFLEKKASERKEDQNDPSHFEVLMEGNDETLVNSAKLAVNESHLSKVLQSIRHNSIDNCMICLSKVDNPVITLCLHIFCRTCLIQVINNIRGFCPICRTILSKDDFMHLPLEDSLKREDDTGFQRSSKMEALFGLINNLKEDDKAVIFSQFLGMMDLIEEDLRREKIGFVRMDGSLSQKERGVAIERFKKDNSCKIFLISLKTGGVGLNLVVANKVILVDPWWNPAVEQQAIERVHRIGQKRAVQVWRLVMQNSIESRMMELHEAKRNVSNMAISERETKENFAQKFKYLMARY